MGANAQTSVPTFTAGDVLTAANMNISAATGVPVFSTTTTRDAAFGGTGEKVLAEGQMCYVENLTGVAQLQYYDGAAWNSLTSGGLVYLTGAAFTTATSFSLPANTFTSTYRNYRLTVTLTAVTSDADLTLRLRSSGSDNTTSNYDGAFAGRTNAGAAQNYDTAGGTAINIGEQDNTEIFYSANLDILGPQVAEPTRILGQFMGQLKTAANGKYYVSGGGNFRLTTQFDSLSFISSVASSLTGTYRVYAYADS